MNHRDHINPLFPHTINDPAGSMQHLTDGGVAELRHFRPRQGHCPEEFGSPRKMRIDHARTKLKSVYPKIKV